MITLPKKWRDEMGIENGDVVKAKKAGNTVVIEAKPDAKPRAPYRVYNDEEIQGFLEDDRLPENVATRVQARLRKPSTPTK
jgi:bifunctional DNA-binding transcriptional regulator/antitoxin component of YhaV-PrlF toxin-antitoxin module